MPRKEYLGDRLALVQESMDRAKEDRITALKEEIIDQDLLNQKLYYALLLQLERARVKSAIARESVPPSFRGIHSIIQYLKDRTDLVFPKKVSLADVIAYAVSKHGTTCSFGKVGEIDDQAGLIRTPSVRLQRREKCVEFEIFYVAGLSALPLAEFDFANELPEDSKITFSVKTGEQEELFMIHADSASIFKFIDDLVARHSGTK